MHVKGHMRSSHSPIMTAPTVQRSAARRVLSYRRSGVEGEQEAQEKEKLMKRMGVLFAVAALAASILSGCVVVPAEEWREGRRERWHEGWHEGWREGHEGWHRY